MCVNFGTCIQLNLFVIVVSNLQIKAKLSPCLIMHHVMQTLAGVKAELNGNIYVFATSQGGFVRDDKRKSLDQWGTKHRLATP